MKKQLYISPLERRMNDPKQLKKLIDHRLGQIERNANKYPHRQGVQRI